MKSEIKISPAQGKLGILTPGMGAVATTFVAGVYAVLQGQGKPIGSLTQMGTIRLGKRTDKRIPLIKDFVSLSELDDLVFGGWDIFSDDMYAAAVNAGVLERQTLDGIKTELESVRPMPAVFDQSYVKRLSGTNVKKGKTKMDLADLLRADIQSFKAEHKLNRLVMIWCASTEVYIEPSPVHLSLAAFEKGLKGNDPAISPSMIYAYAALNEGVPFGNGAPNLTIDIP
ncbi:MAG: inositol-3-phosphate synthase, partial [Desulfobacterales bacterium]